MGSMAVVIDYQNVHMTAADVFLPGRPKEDALISPLIGVHGVSRRNTLVNPQ